MDDQGINGSYLVGGCARVVGLREECWTEGTELVTPMMLVPGEVLTV